MTSPMVIFCVGLFAASLCLIFFVVTMAEMRRLGREADEHGSRGSG